MLKFTNDKIHLSVNVEKDYFDGLDKIAAKDALLTVKSCLADHKDILGLIITDYGENGNAKSMYYLSEIINAGIRNSEKE